MKPQSYFARLEPGLISRAQNYPVAVLCDVAGRRGMMQTRIQPLHPRMKLAGQAFTVEVRPGDNLMFHVALALAQPGDIVVVDGKADTTCALFGELMAAQAEAARLGGFVVDAASRDTDELRNGSFPIFSIGSTPGGPTKSIPGRINLPISVGGVAVCPGDIVIGDADGVVAIPQSQFAAVLSAADEKIAAEKQRLAEIASGMLVSPWLPDAMEHAGLPPLHEMDEYGRQD